MVLSMRAGPALLLHPPLCLAQLLPLPSPILQPQAVALRELQYSSTVIAASLFIVVVVVSDGRTMHLPSLLPSTVHTHAVRWWGTACSYCCTTPPALQSSTMTVRVVHARAAVHS